MGIVRFALRFPYTFYVLAAFIVFLGVSAITVMPVPAPRTMRAIPRTTSSRGSAWRSIGVPDTTMRAARCGTPRC